MTTQPERHERLLDDPDIRRGLRIGGRFLAAWMIFGAVMFVVVLTVVIIVMVHIMSMT